MNRYFRLVVLASLLIPCAALAAQNDAAAYPSLPTVTPPACVCSKPTVVSMPDGRGFTVAQCQCGALSCVASAVASSVALQCLK
jgi:hypothetical protein